ncbi:MAG: NAD-dependent epimerase/dehydratase family protein [Chitinivibrionales bacterium]
MAAILVTGATGFIGQHLVRKLLTDGHTVRAIRFGTEAISFFDPEEVEWRNGDLRAPMSLDGICDGIDIVYHLGAISRNDLRKTWKDFEDVNIRGTQYLCEQASRSGVKRFVFISSVEAAGYGDGKKPRTEEELCPVDLHCGGRAHEQPCEPFRG